MRVFNARFVKLAVLACLACFPVMTGCGDGSSSHNYEGISVTATGWWTYDREMKKLLPLVEANVPLNWEVGGIANTASEIGSNAYLAVQNNLSGQAIRITKVYKEFYIPNAAVQPPAMENATGTVLFADGHNNVALFEGQDENGNASTSSIPGSLVAGSETEFPENYNSTVGYAYVPVAPREVIDFITVNRELMPPLPFQMVVTAYAEGITTAGDVVRTNDLSFEVVFVDQAYIDSLQEQEEDEEDDEDDEEDIDEDDEDEEDDVDEDDEDEEGEEDDEEDDEDYEE